MNLFNAEKSVGGNLIGMARALMLEDVTVNSHGTNEPKVSEAYSPSSIEISVSVKLTVERIKELLNITGTELTKTGKYNRHGNAVTCVTDACKPEPRSFSVSIEEDLSFRGLRNLDAKKARMLKVHKSMLDKFNASKDELIQDAIGKLNDAVMIAIAVHNKKIQEALRRIVVDLNMSEEALTKCLSDEENMTVKEGIKDINELQKKIDVLKEQKKAKTISVYRTKRGAVERKLTAQSGEKGLAILGALKEDKKHDIFEELFNY